MPVNPLLDSLNDTQNETVKDVEALLVSAIANGLEEKDGPVKAMITDSGSFCIYNTDVSPEISAPPIPAEYTPNQLSSELWGCGLFNDVTMLKSNEPSTLINQLLSALKKLPDNTLLLSAVRKPLDQKKVKELFDESVYTT